MYLTARLTIVLLCMVGFALIMITKEEARLVWSRVSLVVREVETCRRLLSRVKTQLG